MPPKPVLALCVVLLAWFLGYLIEPIIVRPLLEIKESDKQTETAPDKEDPTATPATPTTPDFDLTGITNDQLPPTVVLKKTSNFKNSESGLTITVDAGRSVKLIGLEGTQVVISPPGMDYSVMMPAERTNLVDQLIALGVQPGQPGTSPTPVTPDPVTPDPVTPDPVTPDPVTPDPVTPDPVTPDPVSPNPATPTPVTPTPKPEPIVAGPQLSETQIVTAMQNHLKGGGLKEFSFNDVTEWKAGPNKELDGVNLQTGLVTYTTQTLFGEKTLEAQAFLSNGKVIRWIWPKSGIVLE